MNVIYCSSRQGRDISEPWRFVLTRQQQNSNAWTYKDRWPSLSTDGNIPATHETSALFPRGSNRLMVASSHPSSCTCCSSCLPFAIRSTTGDAEKLDVLVTGQRNSFIQSEWYGLTHWQEPMLNGEQGPPLRSVTCCPKRLPGSHW